MHHRWEFRAGEVRGIADARREFVEHLRLVGSPCSDLDGAAIIYGELVANAIRYGTEPIVASLTYGDRAAYLVIEDGGPGFRREDLRPAVPTEPGGRGFAIATALARTISLERGASGFRITVELPVTIGLPVSAC